MSDNDGETGSKLADKSVFSEKEEAVLKVAWSCLKTPPEIDYDKLLIAGGFNTMKTAQNTWGKIKKKLAAFSDGGDAPSMPKPPTTPKTKKKGTATGSAKKRVKNDMDEDDDDEDNPQSAKKPRRTPVKEEKVEADEDEV